MFANEKSIDKIDKISNYIYVYIILWHVCTWHEYFCTRNFYLRVYKLQDIGREWNKRDVFGEHLVELFATNFHATKDTTSNSWKIRIFKDKSMFLFSSGVYSRSFMIRDSREKTHYGRN